MSSVWTVWVSSVTCGVVLCLARSASAQAEGAQEPAAQRWGTVKRLSGNPIIHPGLDPGIGTNINGPSLIRAPSWIQKPLGAYYLYFADHRGKHIRLAFADHLSGPWTIRKEGSLQLSQSHFTDHIASPDVIVDEERQTVRMYYHGLTPEEKSQHTRVALSGDGIHFTAQEEPVGKGSAYWRIFRRDGWWYALAMPGKLFRSRDGLSVFEPGPQLFPVAPTQVHSAVLLTGDTLRVFFTRAGDTPERILYSQVKLTSDWNDWTPTAPEECLAPELPWEGAELPKVAGRIGALEGPAHALRDPAVFQEARSAYLLYAVAGESGIAIAELRLR